MYTTSGGRLFELLSIGPQSHVWNPWGQVYSRIHSFLEFRTVT